MRFRISAGVAAALLAAAAHADVPTYSTFELQARANFSTAFNLPVGAQVVNNRPDINDDGTVTFSFFDLNLDKVMWYGGHGSGSPISQPFYFASDPSLNAAGDIAWRVSEDPDDPDGVWFSAAGGTPQFLTNGPLNSTYWGEPQIIDDGRIAYRATAFGANFYTVYDPGNAGMPFTNVVSESPSTYTFLAVPAVNNVPQFSARVFNAQLNDRQQIRRFNIDGSSTLIAEPGGNVTGFLNNTGINDNGTVAYHAYITGGGDAVYVGDGTGAPQLIASTAAGFSEIAFFAPVVNNNGLVAFRGTGSAGEGVYVADGTTTAPAIVLGDVVPTPAGPATVIDISSGININNNGDVVCNLELSVGGLSVGRGIVVAYADATDCAGDITGDSIVDFDDFAALSSCWGAPCGDLTGDATTDFDDFAALSADWNCGL